MCGEEASEVLISNLEKIHNMPREVVLARYDLVEKSIKAVFGYGADLLIEHIRRNLLKALPGADPNLSVKEIIDRSHEKEILDFLRNVGEHEHVVFIHKTDQVGDSVLRSFLDPSFGGSKGVILSKARSLDKSVVSVRYEEMFRKARPDWMKSLAELTSELGSASRGYGIRLAGEDDSWFFRNGFEDEIISLEQALGPHIKDKMSVLCTYRLADLSESRLTEIALAHSQVIVDDPLMIYKTGGVILSHVQACAAA